MSSPSRALPTTQNFNHYPINRSGVASNIDATPLYYPCIGLASTSPYSYAGLFHDEEVVVFLAFLDKDILVVEEHRCGGGEVYVGHLLLID